MEKQKPALMPVILSVFFLSGAAGGIYEVIWTKQLLLVFGASSFAISTVLTSYMAGLAIGSYFIGKYVDRKQDNPIKIFAFLELCIGVCGILIIFLIPLINKVYYSLYSTLLPNFYLKNIVRFVLCFLVLVVPTILMGGTLPVLSRGLFTRENSFGRHIGSLYSINTLGAMSGALLVGFFFLPNLSIVRSTLWAFAFNSATALIAFAVSNRYLAAEKLAVKPISHGERAKKKKKETEDKKTKMPFGDEPLPGTLLLGVAAVAGFTSMSYQIIYTRLLKLVFSNTIYAFTIILVAFLAGIGLGSLVVARFADRIKRKALTIGLIQIALGIAAIWAMPIVFSSLTILNKVYGLYKNLGWNGYTFSRFTVSFLVILGISSLSGATFPLVIKFRKKGKQLTGERVGEVYAVNTLAAVIGSFTGGFVVIPALGTYWGLIAVLSLNVIAGMLAIFRSKLTSQKRKLIIVAAGILAVIASIAVNPKIIFVGKLKKPGENIKVVYMDEGASASIYLLLNTETNSRKLYTDGILAIDTSYESLQTIRLLGHIPTLLCRDPKDVLVIGFGMGKTTSSIARHPVESIDCIEIVPEVIKAARYFKDLNDDILSDPRVNIVIDDGRSFLFGMDKKYDVISCDPIHPAFGSPALYTREYYSECSRKLKDGGLIVQYLPFHQLSPYDLSILLRTFSSVFPHTSIWLASYHGIVVGSRSRIKVDLKELEEKMKNKGVRLDLEQSNIKDANDFISRMILDEDQVRNLVSGTHEINTDGHPILEYAESRFFGKDTWTDNIENIVGRMNSKPYSSIFEHSAMDSIAQETFSDIFRARLHAVRGRLYFQKGMQAKAVEEFNNQLNIKPGDEETIFFAGDALRSHYMAKVRDLINKGDKAAALANLEKAIFLGLGSADIYINTGMLHISLGDTLQGINALEKALESDPQHPTARKILSSLKEP
jgi:spermidine synthase